MEYSLIPKFENVKSYYNKAIIEKIGNWETLKSYDVEIVNYCNTTKEYYFGCKKEHLTTTTLRHIKEFLLQKGEDVKTLNKKSYLKKIGG